MRTLLLSWIGATTMFALVAAPAAQAQTQYWRLNLIEEEGLELGTIANVGGLTNEDGVRFTLDAGSVNSPIVATVVAKDPKSPVSLSIFKEEGHSLFEETTDKKGKVTSRLRTGEEIYFKVSGNSGSAYQLSVWRGPEVILPSDSPMLSMKEFGGVPAGADLSSAPQPNSTSTEKHGGGVLITILLIGIFLALAAIAFLIFRGQQLKTATAAWLVGAFLVFGFSGEAGAESIDLRPGLVEKKKRDPRLAEEAHSAIKKLKTVLDGIKKASGGKLDGTSLDMSAAKKWGLTNSDFDVASGLNTALNLMELFEIIDPREKFVQPDMNPKGLPALPSRALDDHKLPTDEAIKFDEMQDKINAAKLHLEKNYVVLKQTELQTKRYEELADAASGLSGIAGLYWSATKANPNDPMNKSKAGFYKKYDGGQQNGLEYLNEALKEIGEFEYENYGDRNWYLYYGLPYYNFMVSRYVRK